MVHAKALYRDLPARDKSVTVPPQAAWNVPEEKNPWKETRSWSERELVAILDSGVESNPVIEFDPVEFSSQLMPARRLGAVTARPLEDSNTSRGHHEILTWFDSAPGRPELQVTRGADRPLPQPGQRTTSVAVPSRPDGSDGT